MVCPAMLREMSTPDAQVAECCNLDSVSPDCSLIHSEVIAAYDQSCSVLFYTCILLKFLHFEAYSY